MFDVRVHARPVILLAHLVEHLVEAEMACRQRLVGDVHRERDHELHRTLVALARASRLRLDVEEVVDDAHLSGLARDGESLVVGDIMHRELAVLEISEPVAGVRVGVLGGSYGSGVSAVVRCAQRVEYTVRCGLGCLGVRR